MYSVIQNGLTNVDPTAMLTVVRRPGRPLTCTNIDPATGMPNAALGPCIETVIPFFGTSIDVSKPPTFFAIAGFGISILAIVSALLQLVQSRMMLPAADPTNDDPNARIQRQMMLFLPLISVVYGGFLPAGLFIYWIVATIFSIVAAVPHRGLGLACSRSSAGRRPSPATTPRASRWPCHHPPEPSKRAAILTDADKKTTAEQDDPPTRARTSGPTRETTLTMSAYKEFTGKTVEEALKAARDEFGAELNDLDFEILTPGSRGVLGMGAEPARIVAAPRTALGGAAPKREAAAAQPLPPRAAARVRRPRRAHPGATTVAPPRRPRPRRRPARPPTAGATTARERTADRGPRRDDRPP